MAEGAAEESNEADKEESRRRKGDQEWHIHSMSRHCRIFLPFLPSFLFDCRWYLPSSSFIASVYLHFSFSVLLYSVLESLRFDPFLCCGVIYASVDWL